MDPVDDMDMLTGSNSALQQDCNLGKVNNILFLKFIYRYFFFTKYSAQVVVPGLRRRHLGKSGLKVEHNTKYILLFSILLQRKLCINSFILCIHFVGCSFVFRLFQQPTKYKA